MANERKRLTAVKSKLEEIISGRFVAAEGLESAYVLTTTGRVSRCRILGTVVNKFQSEDDQYAFVVIDDESETIRVKAFKNTKIFAGIERGDIIDVIGKVREYNGERYVSPEIVRKIENPNWLVLRLAELAVQGRRAAETRAKIESLRSRTSDAEELKKLAAAEGLDIEFVEAVLESQARAEENPRVYKEAVLNAIGKLDKGDGAEYAAVMSDIQMNEARVEEAINSLISEGTIYEPRPGRVKKL